MSELLTLTSGSSGTTYGTLAAAINHIDSQLGDQYTAWLDLSVDDRKRSLIGATKYIDRHVWVDDYDTFAERDALEAFQLATYELAALAAEDSSILSAVDSGSNIKEVGAGGAFVEYFNPTSTLTGNATKLPPILQALIGQYLATSETLSAIGGDGEAGNCHDPFSSCADYDRKLPY